MEMIQWLRENGYQGFNADVTDDVSDPEIVRWMFENSQGALTYDHTFVLAAEKGCLETMELLQAFCSASSSTNALVAAARNDQHDVVQWLFRSLPRGARFRREAIESDVKEAARNGHFEMIKRLHAHRTWTQRPQFDISDAVVSGHFEIAKWLVENSDRVVGANDIDCAVKSGDLELVIWLHENSRASCTGIAMDDGAGRGYLDILEWLHENRTEGCTTGVMYDGAKRGDFDALLFLHENRTEVRTTQAAVAAYWLDHVDIFQWLLDNYPDVIRIAHLVEEAGDCSDRTTYFLENAKRVKRQRIS